jgi:hypothetical protein
MSFPASIAFAADGLNSFAETFVRIANDVPSSRLHGYGLGFPRARYSNQQAIFS